MSRIVVIDDSTFVVEKLRWFLGEKLGHTIVATGTTGIDAINLYREHRPDLITVDIAMPLKRGDEAVQEIIQEFPSAKILVISAIRTAELVKCLTYGAAGYIEKPLRFNEEEFVIEFKRTIQDVLPQNN